MNWKLWCSFLSSFLLIVSCGTKHSTIKEYVKNADSASVAFFEKGDSSSQIVIRDKPSIKKLSSYMNGKSIEPKKCVEDGSIWFYETGKKKMQVDFTLNGENNSFSYMMNDKIYVRLMSDDATKYLTSVKRIASDSL